MFLLYSLSLGAPIWHIGVGGPRVCPVRTHSSYATGYLSNWKSEEIEETIEHQLQSAYGRAVEY
jgi:hypothetical protein